MFSLIILFAEYSINVIDNRKLYREPGTWVSLYRSVQSFSGFSVSLTFSFSLSCVKYRGDYYYGNAVQTFEFY